MPNDALISWFKTEKRFSAHTLNLALYGDQSKKLAPLVISSLRSRREARNK